MAEKHRVEDATNMWRMASSSVQGIIRAPYKSVFADLAKDRHKGLKLNL